MTEKNIQKGSKAKNIGLLDFPRKLNSATIAVLIVIYTILIAFLMMLFPKYTYTVIPQYDHMMSNRYVTCYLKLDNTVTVSNSKVIQKSRVEVQLDSNYSGGKYTVHYEVSGLDKNGNMNYFDCSNRASYMYTPMTHVLQSGQTVGGDGYERLFGYIKYRIVQSTVTEDELPDKNEEESNKEDNKDENKYSYTYYFKFSEPVISLTKKEVKAAETDKNVFNELLSINTNVVNSTESGYYRYNIGYNINTKDLIYHFDVQSFFVTDENEIYPITGFYNVYNAYKKNFSSSGDILKELNPKYIVIKGYYTNSNGESTKILYKYEINK